MNFFTIFRYFNNLFRYFGLNSTNFYIVLVLVVGFINSILFTLNTNIINIKLIVLVLFTIYIFVILGLYIMFVINFYTFKKIICFFYNKFIVWVIC